MYGTLRPAWGNSRLWRQLGARVSHDGQAAVAGYVMWEHGIPFAVPGDGTIVGALIKPSGHRTEAEWLRRQLDSLEGHPRWYRRVPCAVNVPDGGPPIIAWIYRYMRSIDGCRPVPSGDFADTLVGRTSGWSRSGWKEMLL